jgi:shikimate kinase
MKNNIVLIGFMGVGKGNISRMLSKKLDRLVLDTDDVIVSMEKRTIKAIFKKEGEGYFRDLENKVCRWMAAGIDQTIIATGGGFPVYVDDIKALGKVIYLKNSFHGIMARIDGSANPKKKLKKRPLFKDPKKAKALLESRLEKYAAVADVTIDVEGKLPDAVLAEIVAALAL